jgi:outer membrane lipoprotein-sorting protein
MRRRLPLIIVVLVVAAAALTIGLVVARADTTANLPQTTAADLLFNMATTDHQNLVVSGSVSWTNDLFGNASLVSVGQGSAQLPLLSSGSGRIWIQGGNVRIESQGQSGDQVIVFSMKDHVAWVWDGGKNTAAKYNLPAGAGQSASPEPSPTETFGVAQIDRVLKEMLPTAKVEVTGTTSIGGHDAYLLTLTPSTSDTALGSVQVAVDGHTYLPLRVQVFAVGHSKPTLSFGFTSVSYSPVSSDLFTFTPPAGAKVTTHDVQAPQTHPSGAEPTAQPSPEPNQSPLTLAQAQAKAGFTVASPQNYTARPFDGAWVVDKAQIEKQLAQLQKQMAASGQTPPAEPTTGASPAPGQSGQPSFDPSKLPATAVVQKYGTGFGTIWLAQAPDNAEVDKALAQLPSIFGQQTIAGDPAHVVDTPLGGIAVWKQNGVTLIAGGMVSQADLNAFISSVQ